MEVAGGYIARHARYAHRASRACKRTSSPRIASVIAVFRFPRTRPARARCSGGGARSLPPLRARGVAVVEVMAIAVGHAARHTHHALRASRARTCASSTGDTRVITVPSPPHARTPTLQRNRRSLAPSIARALCMAGNAIMGAFRCHPPPSHPTHPPDNPLQAAPFLIARYDDDARAKRKAPHSRTPVLALSVELTAADAPIDEPPEEGRGEVVVAAA